MHWIPDGVGWTATAVFALSYFFDDSRKIRWVQAAAATVWAGYGALIHSLPVIASNLIVVALAAATAWRRRDSIRGSPRSAGKPAGGQDPAKTMLAAEK